MSELLVRPALLRGFGGASGAEFVVVTDPELAPRVRFDALDGYSGSRVIPYDGSASFDDVLARSVPACAHVLVILPRTYFKSPEPSALGPRRKLGVMACFSAPTSFEAIQHFLRMAERTDPARQERMADQFFERGR